MKKTNNKERFTSSEQVGGQTHSIPMLLSLRAAISSGGFKLEKTSFWMKRNQTNEFGPNHNSITPTFYLKKSSNAFFELTPIIS